MEFVIMKITVSQLKQLIKETIEEIELPSDPSDTSLTATEPTDMELKVKHFKDQLETLAKAPSLYDLYSDIYNYARTTGNKNMLNTINDLFPETQQKKLFFFDDRKEGYISELMRVLNTMLYSKKQ